MYEQLKIKRIFDVMLSLLALIVLSPVLCFAAVGILVSNPGPIIYKARRMGKGMQPYNVYKFRTMYVNADKAGGITAVNDSRVFPFGNILRKYKIDELPQLVNVLNGTMSIVGPRPEGIEIVNKYYTKWMKKTLNVLPGLASPGSIFNYTHGDAYLQSKDPERDYIEQLMPVKLAMDFYYVKYLSVIYDVEIIIRTIYVIVAQLLGKTEFKYPREYRYAVSRLKRGYKYKKNYENET